MIDLKNTPARVIATLSFTAMVSACCSAGRASPPPDTALAREHGAAMDDSVDARVRAMLSGYEHVPTAEDWARIGTPAEVSAALVRVAEKPDGQTVAALRATSSLAHFPRPEVATFLEARLVDTRVTPAMRGKAAIALAAGFGDVKARVIAPLFASPDEGLREDAIRAFKRFSSPTAERFLDERQKAEPNERLRTALGEAKREVVDNRAAKTKAASYPKELDELPPIADPGPVR